MPTCTPVYLLPYPIGVDPPCDVNDTLCALAARVEAVFDGFDATIARTFTAIPMAKVSLSTPQLIDPNVTVPSFTVRYDTTLEDTDDMVDLALANNAIFARRPGIYMAKFYFELGTSGSVLNTYQASIGAFPPLSGTSVATQPPNSTSGDLLFADPNLANSMSYTLREYFKITTPGSFFTSTVWFAGFIAGAMATLNRAEFDVEWMADL